MVVGRRWVILHLCMLLLFLKILFILERGKGREKERERNINVWSPLMCLPHQWGPGPTIQACALTGNRTCNPLVCSLCSTQWATLARATLPFWLEVEYTYCKKINDITESKMNLISCIRVEPYILLSIKCRVKKENIVPIIHTFLCHTLLFF